MKDEIKAYVEKLNSWRRNKNSKTTGNYILRKISPTLYIYRDSSNMDPVIFLCRDNIIKPLGKFFSNECIDLFINNLEGD